MSPERWKQVEEIFIAALEREPAARPLFLHQVCGGDAVLRLEVESLLAHEERADAFLQSSVAEAAQAVESVPEPDGASAWRIGPYAVIREIGRGGMGTVYLAARADDQFRQQVAIKLVSRGMGSEYALSHFLRERQVLANLNYPGIARLLDGGATEDGLPYFAMEYVDGRPITAYCEAGRLGLEERLKLFRRACAAVQYAHQNLVVHRDIKPSNLLITSEGSPKLLDFGIAKLLDAGSSGNAAATTVLMLTPDYASPEQVRGASVGTATDVYSLGVLLYELLTGALPHRFTTRTPQEIERVICTLDPPKPSQCARDNGSPVARKLSGDLDNIVQMALRKEPERRYSSVEQFSADIGRYLDGRPVLARDSTLRYRAGKFVRRHRLALSAAALLAVTLAGGIVGVSWQARRATRQADLAQRRFQQVRTLANTFLFDIDGRIRSLPGSTEARALIIQTALSYLDGLAAESGGEPTLTIELAGAYERIGDVQGNPGQPNLGQSAAARQSYEKGVALLEPLRPAGGGADPAILKPLASLLDKLGAVEVQTGESAKAREHFARGLAIAEQLLAARPSDADVFRLLTDAYVRAGVTSFRAGDVRASLEPYRKALKLTETWAAAHPGEDVQNTLATAHRRVGSTLLALGDLERARSSFAEVVRIREALSANRGANATVRRNLALAYNFMGDLLSSRLDLNFGLPAEAMAYYRRSQMILEDLVDADRSNVQAARDLLYTYLSIATLDRDVNPAAALQFSLKGFAIAQRITRADPANSDFRRDLALSEAIVAYPQFKLGRHREALQNYLHAAGIYRGLLQVERGRMLVRHELVFLLNETGDLQLRMGSRAEALSSYRKALEIASAAAAEQPSNLKAHAYLADCYERAGAYHASLKDWPAARNWYQKSLDIWTRWTGQAVSSSYSRRRKEQAARALAEAAP